jgi:dienelactone hydrolase
MFSGALPLAVMGIPGWPAGVPVQVHYGEGDPFRAPEWLDAFIGEVRSGGGDVELVEHPVAGHLFTDPSMTAEYDAAAAERLWERALAFCDRVAG